MGTWKKNIVILIISMQIFHLLIIEHRSRFFGVKMWVCVRAKMIEAKKHVVIFGIEAAKYNGMREHQRHKSRWYTLFDMHLHGHFVTKFPNYVTIYFIFNHFFVSSVASHFRSVWRTHFFLIAHSVCFLYLYLQFRSNCSNKQIHTEMTSDL